MRQFALRVFVFLVLFIDFSNGIARPNKEQQTAFDQARNVSKKLAETKQDSFSDMFDSVSAYDFLQFVKGYSIAGEIIDVFLNLEDPAINTIVKELRSGFERLTTQMTQQIVDIEMEIGEEFYNMSVRNPIVAASKRMNALLKSGDVRDKMSKLLFASTFQQADIPRVFTNIFDESQERFNQIFNATKFNYRIFKSTKDSLTQIFFQTIALQSFYHGMLSQCSNSTKDIKKFQKEANATRMEFSTLMTKITDGFYKKVFLGRTIVEDIIKKGIDSTKNNFDAATAILKEMKKRYPGREYTVAVFKHTTSKKDFSQFGFNDRKIFLEKYNNKNAIIFMSTTKFLEHSKKYRDNNYRGRMKNQKEIDEKGVLPLTSFIANGTSNSQIAVIVNTLFPGIVSSHPQASDIFNHTLTFTVLTLSRAWNVSYAVNF